MMSKLTRYWTLSALVIAQCTMALAAAQTDADRDYSKMIDEQNVQFIRQLQSSLKDAGYENARIIPQMFIALGNKPGQALTVIVVDYNTMQVREIPSAVEFVSTAKGSRPETDLPKMP